MPQTKRKRKLGRWPERVKGEAKVGVRISARRFEAARKVAPSRLRHSPGLLVEEALIVWSITRRRELFDRSMARMARDPQAMAVNRQISQEFSVADADGLGGL